MPRYYRMWLLASICAWPLLAVSLGVCVNVLPPFDSYTSDWEEDHYPLFQTWIGQDKQAARINTFLLLLGVYAAKFFIVNVSGRWLRLYFYIFLVVFSLPFIWFCVVIDWYNIHVARFACWIYYPVGIWFVPSLSFIVDTWSMKKPGVTWYLCRSFMEFLVILPWMYFWIVFSFIFLHGGWI